MTDPIADMLTRIRNGYLARLGRVVLPYSRINEEIAKIMVKNGYLGDLQIKNPVKSRSKAKQVGFKEMELTLKYQNKKPVVRGIKRISKPGLRIYRKVRELGRLRSGLGIQIISTPMGLMTSREAKKKNLGGEIICEVW